MVDQEPNTMNVYPSSLFSHIKGPKELHVDISQLEHSEHTDPRFGVFRQHRQALAKGLHIMSSRTGNGTTWLIQDQIMGPDGEVAGWKLTPTSSTIELFPRLMNYVLFVWNT
jgi:hypothetical protein